MPIVVAVDGPAGAGKSTVSRRLARRLGYRFLDTGAIYRTLALAAKEEGIDWDDGPALGARAARLEIELRAEGGENRVLLAGRDVSEAIRTPEMGQGASRVSAHPEVREALLGLQRRLAEGGGVVAEGRDMGTVVFPHAEAKFFLTATVDERARRRMEELRAKGHPVDFETTRREVEERDRRDTERKVAPLRQAEDAVLVDSTDLGIEQVLDRMERIVRQRGG